MTGTGGKPWLIPPQLAATLETVPPAETPRPNDEPVTAPDADENLAWVVVGMKVVGAVLLGIALLLVGEVWMFAKNGRTVTGRVVIEWRADPLAFAMYYRDPVIQYEVNGVKYELPAGKMEEGQQVEIMYPPADPQKGRIRGPLYQLPRLVGAAGLMLLLSGVAVGTSLAYAKRTKSTTMDTKDSVA